MFVYARLLHLGVYETEPWFGIKKLGVVFAYPCLNMLVVFYCGIPPAGDEPSMVV
jgi:hypothetical protein